jgi:L-serine dehydratase
VQQSGQLVLFGKHTIRYDEAEHLVMRGRDRLPGHVNGMRFTALNAAGLQLASRVYYSVGGGFVVAAEDVDRRSQDMDDTADFPFHSADDLLAMCREYGRDIAGIVMANELRSRTREDVLRHLSAVWSAMRDCVAHGCSHEGVLPGGLRVQRRAPALHHSLKVSSSESNQDLEWVTLWAMAVNEENAAGGRVVTAPTNGAAGVVPAVLHYYERLVPSADLDGVFRFLLTATAVGGLCKENASISGAEVGCQGEIGSACAMAAAGLAAALGATPEQVENAAEIGMEHNLGLTCDPVGGLVQIPCIERNALAAVQAIAAARLALRGDGEHRVSLDRVIATMRQTGNDMKMKYKETSMGGLAVNVAEC